MVKKKVQVLMAAFEAAPFFKTGGLGEVAGSLPSALKKENVEVRLILPKAAALPERFAAKLRHIADFKVPVGWRWQYCGVEELKYKYVTYYFLDNEYYFKRDGLYGYGDEAERMAFFAKAVLESIQYLPDFQPDIVHCNDWHTALTPVFLREQYMAAPEYARMKTVFSVHNLKYQGQFGGYLLGDLLGLTSGPALSQLIYDNDLNYMCGALCYSDRLLTVSPTYADEVCTPSYGEGLDAVFRRRRNRLRGILNGIDYKVYNPENDKNLPAVYSASDMAGKAICKAELQKRLNLPENPEAPLLAVVSRLTEQKGLDLLLHILQELLQTQPDVQLAVLGLGDERYEHDFGWFSNNFANQVAYRREFDDNLAHNYYAGADLLLMPSRFEPCGLAQMIAMRYGTLPLVRETGGLKDSVLPYNRFTGEGTGFSFANYNAHEMLFTLQNALDLYRTEPEVWQGLMTQAMQQDFSWQRSAKEYAGLYRELLAE